MTDGPFKNAKLSGNLKRFGDSLINTAIDWAERIERAESALMRDLPKSLRQLIYKAEEVIKNSRSDISTRQAVESLFEKHNTTPCADTLHRYYKAYISRPIALGTAWTYALDSMIKKEASRLRMRMTEEMMHMRDSRKLSKGEFAQASANLRCLNEIGVSKVRQVLTTKKSSRIAAFVKQRGDDDGPIG